MVESLYPPHSRLFVACDRETTEEELIGEFQNYGSVVNVKLSRERSTGKPKGFAFVQYDKTSEAAAAVEGMNGRTIGRSTRPIKVTVALTKDISGNTPSNEPSQFLRLFLVVPKHFSEEDLRQHFSQFGTIDTVSIVKDRESKESKGYGYVKYKRFVHAAKGFEECDRAYKAVFAKPKEQYQTQQGGVRSRDHMGGPAEPLRDRVVACTHIDENREGYTSLWALVSASLSDEQIEWMFDIPPGLEYVRFFKEPPRMSYSPSYTRKVMVQYDSPGTAAYALRKLSGFEYPAGDSVQIKPNYDSVGNGQRPPRTSGAGASVSSLMQQVESLTKSLSEATRVIRSSGLGSSIGGFGGGGGGGRDGGQIDSFRCSADLPPPQPLAPKNSTAQERLFWVCEPGLPPQDALWDVFGRFGSLIEFYVLNGKNCGYAKYADKDAALNAVKTLNGQELYRMRMKVLVAEPQEARKRPRTDD